MRTFKCNDCGHRFRAYGTADSETCPECKSRDLRRIDDDDDHHHRDSGFDIFNPLSPVSIFGGLGDGGGGFVGGGGHSGGGGASGEW